jgi:hypothetical protein
MWCVQSALAAHLLGPPQPQQHPRLAGKQVLAEGEVGNASGA